MFLTIMSETLMALENDAVIPRKSGFTFNQDLYIYILFLRCNFFSSNQFCFTKISRVNFRLQHLNMITSTSKDRKQEPFGNNIENVFSLL